ncbi:MAG: exopolyphosphatase [Magnetococcales bacterium]|nr:exopolyphosphatase [Magnetococcales bacterium]
MKFAAIDIGSNAVRLLISNVYDVGGALPVVHKADLYRIPVRLGQEAFQVGRISEKLGNQLVHAMAAYAHILQAVEPLDTMACATSALRSVENGRELVERIRVETGICLEIIAGAREAELIALNRMDGSFNEGRYLYIDVGGGSTELILLENNQTLTSRSFNIGTVRIKEGLVTREQWREMETWTRAHCRGLAGLRGIGSGGNINKLYSMTRPGKDQSFSRESLLRLQRSISRLNEEQRMIQLGLKPDRADVIVPAGRIFLKVTQWAGINRLLVPQIGLADGMVRELYRQWKNKQN